MLPVCSARSGVDDVVHEPRQRSIAGVEGDRLPRPRDLDPDRERAASELARARGRARTAAGQRRKQHEKDQRGGNAATRHSCTSIRGPSRSTRFTRQGAPAYERTIEAR